MIVHIGVFEIGSKNVCDLNDTKTNAFYDNFKKNRRAKPKS